MTTEDPTAGPAKTLLLEKAGPYWARPAEQAVNASLDERFVFMAVGVALTEWETLEIVFASLFGQLIGNEAFVAAARIYGMVDSNAARRKMLREASDAYFERRDDQAKAQATCKHIRDHFEQAAARRNDIAHGCVCHYELSEVNGAFLVPPSYNTRKSDDFAGRPFVAGKPASRTDYRYTSQEIINYANKFKFLKRAVLDFSYEFALARAAGGSGS